MDGVLEARVFGGDLSAICELLGELIPPFIPQLMTFIEEEGIDVEGIYRLSGSQLRNLVLQGALETGYGDEVTLEDVDVHSASACLKLFFRRLPEPLIPTDLYDELIEAARGPEEERLERIAILVRSLPSINYYTLSKLMQHLKRIADNHKVNKMKSKNLGIVFGPTLMRSDKDPLEAARLVMFQNVVVETMVNECESIFFPYEPTYGYDLDELCTHSEGVPAFLTHFMHHVETVSIHDLQIYQGTGMTSNTEKLHINMLKMMVELEDFDLDKYEWATPVVVTTCIKHFFNELPEPLIPQSMYPSFLVAVKSLHTRRAQNLSILVKNLPRSNLIVLRSLIRHLTAVCSMSDQNKLTAPAIGHIFGMLLMRQDENWTLEDVQKNLPLLNRVVEVMVSNYDTVFGYSSRSGRGKVKKISREPVVREPIFGVDITTKCKRDEAEVPEFFVRLIDFLEKKGLDEVGLYRCTVKAATIETLKSIIERGENIDLYMADWINPYVVAETIKLYLKKLPEPLIPSDRYDSFIKAAKTKFLGKKIKQFRNLMLELPEVHYSVFCFFLRHLKKIVQNKKLNKSSAAGMGVLFGNILMRTPSGGSENKLLVLQNSAIETMVRHLDKLFVRKFPVFGSDLAALCKLERETVPTFFTQFLQKIEDKGFMQEVGIYRFSGIKTEVQQVIVKINKSEELDFEGPILTNPGNLTDVVKQYLVTLPEPLIPPDASQNLLASAKSVFIDIRNENMASILKEIPEYNYCTLKAFLDHFTKIVGFSSVNRMTAANLGIIFGPVLMRPDSSKSMIELSDYAKVMKLMIESWPTISHISEKYRYDPVFGCELFKVCSREHRTVPLFFEQAINYIESMGLENKDIYKTLKISSSISCVHNLKKRINQGLNLDKIEIWMSQHVVASCLKLYLRELPDPLIPFSLYQDFVTIIKSKEDHFDRVEEIAKKVKELDFSHYHTLKLLIGHLQKLTNLSDVNDATVSITSVMFGQTIIRPKPKKGEELNLMLVFAQNAIVKAMIQEYESIFP